MRATTPGVLSTAAWNPAVRALCSRERGTGQRALRRRRPLLLGAHRLDLDPRFADADLVQRADRHARDPLPVHEESVAAARIGDVDRAVLHVDHRMPGRNQRIIQLHRGIGRPTDGHDAVRRENARAGEPAPLEDEDFERLHPGSGADAPDRTGLAQSPSPSGKTSSTISVR